MGSEILDYPEWNLAPFRYARNWQRKQPFKQNAGWASCPTPLAMAAIH
jgi:hypothetical protein